MKTLIATTLALVVLPATAHADVPALDFEWTATYGASATDNDGLDSGRDPFEIVFDQGSSAGDVLTNYAQSGSIAAEIVGQFILYRDDVSSSVSQRNTFHAVGTSANDVLRQMTGVAANPPGVDASLDETLDRSINAVLSGTNWLVNHHPDAVLVQWTLPDLTMAPMFEALPPTEVSNMQAHILRINDEIWTLDAHDNVIVVDFYAFMHDMAAAPPVLRGVTVYPEDLYVDNKHPNALGNALAANEIISRINDELGTTIPLLTEDELADIGGIP